MPSASQAKRSLHVRAKYASGLFDELVVDNFAGGGGASLGIERALGRAVDVAINHDRQAVALHTANHPATRHYCEDVWSVDPLEATGGRPVGLAWFSPDCKHFSRAKGGKPVEKKIRGLAWVVVRWAAKVRPRVIMLENVREFETWGPLDESGLPCRKRKGQTFKRWVSTLRNLGYKVEWKTLNAADYGTPTHRRRLFLIARRDGEPIVWPEPTHGPGRKPYGTAADCIDWNLSCPSIFLTREEGRRIGVIRPLAAKTMRRIAMGLKRYVIDNPKPFIVQVNHGGDDFLGQNASRQLSTVTQKHGYGVVTPYFTAQFGEREGQEPRSHRADEPFPTITSRAGGGFPLIAPHITRFFGGEKQPIGKDAGSPLPTITAVDHHGVVSASLVQFNQEKGNETRGQSPESPLNTVPTENRFAVAAAFLGAHYGDRPNGTIREGSVADAPHPTVTAGGKHSVLSIAHLTKFYGTNVGANPGDPMPTVTGQGQHVGEVRAFLTKYFGTGGVGQDCGDPLHTITSHDRFGLVTVAGQDYQIVDIGLRMLRPRELYRAQGFPEDYIIAPNVNGKPLTKAAQVRMCGNSVCPQVSEALVRANFPAEQFQPTKRSRRTKVAV